MDKTTAILNTLTHTLICYGFPAKRNANSIVVRSLVIVYEEISNEIWLTDAMKPRYIFKHDYSEPDCIPLIIRKYAHIMAQLLQKGFYENFYTSSN